MSKLITLVIYLLPFLLVDINEVNAQTLIEDTTYKTNYFKCIKIDNEGCDFFQLHQFDEFQKMGNRIVHYFYQKGQRVQENGLILKEYSDTIISNKIKEIHIRFLVQLFSKDNRLTEFNFVFDEKKGSFIKLIYLTNWDIIKNKWNDHFVYLIK